MSLDGERVLVTGGLGFIGSHLVKRLVEEKADVHVIGTGSAINVASVIGRIKLHQMDITDYGKLKAAVAKINPQKIFHLAAHVNVSRDADESAMVANNYEGTINLVKASEPIDYGCFINTGTCEEYGNGPVPFKESQQPRPVSPYSAAKVRTTNYCMDYCKKTSKPVLTLRPFLTYGPFQKARMLVPYVITSALLGKPIRTTKGEQTRELNYVSDIIDGYILAATKKAAIGQVINIGNGREYQIRQVIRKILQLMGSDVEVDDSLPYRSGEAMHFYCSNEKAKKLLGWQPKTSLESGLKKTIAWYREQHEKGALKSWLS